MILALLLAAQTVAVLEFRDKVPPEQRIDAAYLSDQVRSAVKRSLPDARVITRENMLVLLQASGKDLANCEGECEVDTGRRIGADLVVSGELLRFGTQYKLNMKLHDTRSGELLSGAVASGATADNLDRNLGAAVSNLLEPLRSVQQPRAAAEEATVRGFAFSAHAAGGYGNVSGVGGVTVPVTGGGSAVTGAFSYGFGADAGIHLGSVVSLAVFGEYAAVAAGTWVNVFAGGALARARIIPAFSLALGAGAAKLGSNDTGWAVLGAADYLVYGPLAVHAQLLVANQSSSAGLFSGGDEAVCLTAGVSLLF